MSHFETGLTDSADLPGIVCQWKWSWVCAHNLSWAGPRVDPPDVLIGDASAAL